MNAVTGRSDMNPKHFTPSEVNLMVLNRYNNVRQQLHTVIYLSNSGRKSHWRLIAEIFTQCSSVWGHISQVFSSLSLPFILHVFIFFYLSEALTVWCSLYYPYQIQSIFLSRTTGVGQIVPPGYLPPPHAIIFAIPVSFTSSLMCRSHLHLCYPVSSYVMLSLVLQSQTFDSRQFDWHQKAANQFSTWAFHFLWHLALFAILLQVFYLFLWVWISFDFIPQHSSTWFLWVCG